jgi:hypothetical protein
VTGARTGLGNESKETIRDGLISNLPEVRLFSSELWYIPCCGKEQRKKKRQKTRAKNRVEQVAGRSEWERLWQYRSRPSSSYYCPLFSHVPPMYPQCHSPTIHVTACLHADKRGTFSRSDPASRRSLGLLEIPASLIQVDAACSSSSGIFCPTYTLPQSQHRSWLIVPAGSRFG